MGEGREGDWECSSCNNRNYAFRSLCNRCKQPRIFVDSKTPPDSKWLPRIGDWICTGCTNNNYASREKCKKCGQAKEIAAMPAIAMTAASLRTHPHYFVGAPSGELERNMNVGLPGMNGMLQQPHPFASTWPAGGVADKYGFQPVSTWHFGVNQTSGASFANQPIPVPKGWRNGDWMCNCGFHNYSSRVQCKNCNATVPPALGTKRLASEDFAHDLENKRLNSGNLNGQQRFDQMVGTTGDPGPDMYAPYPSVGSVLTLNWQAPVQFQHQVAAPALLGKGAKQWRNGDWMCTNCSNHNYSSRTLCNRCEMQKEAAAQRVSPPVDAP